MSKNGMLNSSIRATLTLTIVSLLSISILANNYSRSAQRNLIPKELGKVYLGMPFRDFADEVPMGRAIVTSSRFDYLEVKIPINKKSVTDLFIRVHGITRDQKNELVFGESTSDSDEEVEKLELGKIPKEAVVYQFVVNYKPEFDLKKYVLKKYGKDGDVRSENDEFYFYDIQWSKKTSDGLGWLIRSFHEGERRVLKLHGRIPGTEWALD